MNGQRKGFMIILYLKILHVVTSPHVPQVGDIITSLNILK